MTTLPPPLHDHLLAELKSFKEERREFSEWEYELNEAISNDDEEEFISVIEQTIEKDDLGSKAQSILENIVFCNSIKCAEALIKGNTSLKVDLNIPCFINGMLPIQMVAWWGVQRPSITELLLVNGANPNIPFTPSSSSFANSCTNLLPLQIALLRSPSPLLHSWTWEPEPYILYDLIARLCHPQGQDVLETIALLAGMTKKTGDIFLEFLEQGKIIQFATLLMVAHESVSSVMDAARQVIDSMTSKEDMREKAISMRQLVQVFDRAGHELLAYVQKDRCNISSHQTVVDVTHLLKEAGFHLPHTDLDDGGFNRDSWCYPISKYDLREPYEVRRCLHDFGMPHYSASGFRWKVSETDPSWKFINFEAYISTLKDEIEALKEVCVNNQKQQQQPSLPDWLDDKLRKAVEKDDKEEFLSVIECKMDSLCYRQQQQLLYIVCVFGSIKCAEALIEGKKGLTVNLNDQCTDTGMYPLHCAAFSLFPSITELFLHYGAKADIRYTPSCLSHIYPKQLLEQHTNKLPLHMALLGITCLPFISEWTHEHSIYKLITMLCLPRMQNPLETLDLLVGNLRKTGSILKIEDEFTKLAMDGKIVELAALLTVACEDLSDVMDIFGDCIKESPVLNDDRKTDVESLSLLIRVFNKIGGVIMTYIKEDKYNVTIHQAIEDVTCMLQQTDLPLNVSDTDLSIYSWYRNEEPYYPSKAPYENVRVLHDTGMAHYSKSGCRWKVSKTDVWSFVRSAKTQAYVKKMENELKRLKEEEENAAAKKKLQELTPEFGVPYISLQAAPTASSRFFPSVTMKSKADNKMCGASLNLQNSRGMKTMASSRKLPSRMVMSSMTLLLKQIMKNI